MKSLKRNDRKIANKPVSPRKQRSQERKERVAERMERFTQRPAIRFMNRFSLLFQGLLACILVIAIEACSRHSLISAMSFVVGSPLAFLYNALLIFATLLIVYLFKRRMLVRIVISVIWLLLGVINGLILASRVTPFNFTDFKLLSDLLAMKSSKYLSGGEIALIIIALAAVAVFVVYLALRGPKFSGKIHRLRNLVALVAVVACIPAITKGAIHSDILAGYFGNLAQGYRDYGFVYSFSASVVNTGMNKPKGYSEAKIDHIVDSESREKTTISKKDEPNIIFIQLESFIDPYEVKYLHMSKDPIPNFHKLQKKYSSGYLTVPVVGAGTANTEFEILTGMSLRYFGLGEYPYKTVLKHTNVESIADDLGKIGYSTHVLHNNGGNFYGRANVFNEMGFDSFTSKEMMDITKYNEIKTWPTDDILVGETTKTLNSTKNQSDFIYTITVQSHGAYPTEKVFKNPPIKVTGASTSDSRNQWEYYVNEIHEVDKTIGKLIKTLSNRKEKTLVVMYGDHLPTMGLENSDMKSHNIFNTMYVTWNNFGMKKKDANLKAYQLMAHYTDRLGIHEGTMFRYHQSELKRHLTKNKLYMNNLEQLQYDLLYGKNYSLMGKPLDRSTPMEMGVENVVIKGIEPSETSSGKTAVIGKNFTPWSKVYVNGEKVTTQYVSSKCIQVSNDDIKDNDSIVVNQVGSSDTIFRSSNTFKITSVSKHTGIASGSTASSSTSGEVKTATDQNK